LGKHGIVTDQHFCGNLGPQMMCILSAIFGTAAAPLQQDIGRQGEKMSRMRRSSANAPQQAAHRGSVMLQ